VKHKKRPRWLRDLKYFLLRYIGVPLGSLLFRLWQASLRIEYKNINYLEDAHRSGRGIIFSFWHCDLFVTSCAGRRENRRKKIYILTSRSRDGEVFTRFLANLGFGAVRGSSARGGIGAFLGLNRKLRLGMNTALALDGPRGPCFEVKIGALLLAKTSRAILLPFAVHCHSKITLRSWDRCEIPLPFSRCEVKLGKPIAIRSDADGDSLEASRMNLENTLRKLKGIATYTDS